MGFDLSVNAGNVIVVPIEHFDRMTTLKADFRHNLINRRSALVLGIEENLVSVSSGPAEGPDPAVEILRQILPHSRLALIQHQPKAVALVSWTLLGAVGDVLAI